ncbi:MAG: hypothetical protein ACFFCS_26880 [Candidatus Hodarchaeota archaeon]
MPAIAASMAWRNALPPATGPSGCAWMPPPDPIMMSQPQSRIPDSTICGLIFSA